MHLLIKLSEDLESERKKERKKMKLWKAIHNQLSLKQSVLLLIVLENKGSSPGKQGFKMMVGADDTLEGSIGGGIMEYNMVEHARALLQKQIQQIEIKHQVHNTEAESDQSGMICSGKQTIAFVPLSDSDMPTIEKIIQTLAVGKQVYMHASPQGLALQKAVSMADRITCLLPQDGTWSYHESLGYKHRLLIFGAGHVSVALSQVFNLLGFYVELFDNRKNLNTFHENKFVHQKHVIDYKQASRFVTEGKQTYVVIMTFSHDSDLLVLSKLWDKKINYLGLMGSKNKVKKLFGILNTKGVTLEQLAHVHAPIGVDIRSETPTEIAISIAAQIIDLKNKGRK